MSHVWHWDNDHWPQCFDWHVVAGEFEYLIGSDMTVSDCSGLHILTTGALDPDLTPLWYQWLWSVISSDHGIISAGASNSDLRPCFTSPGGWCLQIMLLTPADLWADHNWTWSDVTWWREHSIEAVFYKEMNFHRFSDQMFHWKYIFIIWVRFLEMKEFIWSSLQFVVWMCVWSMNYVVVKTVILWWISSLILTTVWWMTEIGWSNPDQVQDHHYHHWLENVFTRLACRKLLSLWTLELKLSTRFCCVVTKKCSGGNTFRTGSFCQQKNIWRIIFLFEGKCLCQLI